MTGISVTAYGATVALAASAAVTMLFLRAKKAACPAVDPLRLALVCLPAALIGARLLYCFARADYYLVELGVASVFRTWEGGFLLYGAAFGAIAAAALLARLYGASVPAALDEMAAPGMLAVVVCRLAERFTPEGVGPWLENEALCRFPFAVRNEYGEWQLALFFMEALAAALILFHLLRMRRRADRQAGEEILRALLLYACCQIVFESLRMDSCLRVGFVRVSQVISGVVILGVTVIATRRRGGWRAALGRAAATLACVGAVGGIEWALDKTSVPNIALYAAMCALCAAMAANALGAGSPAKDGGGA
ncbi:MAG: prolipoprotein diacylglyceryl transferase [Clostridia bacterium]|nr:prolipoprotein diacylglyceryl transferase [Clostridia bacterium]